MCPRHLTSNGNGRPPCPNDNSGGCVLTQSSFIIVTYVVRNACLLRSSVYCVRAHAPDGYSSRGGASYKRGNLRYARFCYCRTGLNVQSYRHPCERAAAVAMLIEQQLESVTQRTSCPERIKQDLGDYEERLCKSTPLGKCTPMTIAKAHDEIAIKT
jgi:hypothetical protein